MLTRIYGTAWENPKDLKAYLAFLEEVEKRDHRRLGKELDLFSRITSYNVCYTKLLRGERFIHQEKRGLDGQGPGYGNPLFLPPR